VIASAAAEIHGTGIQAPRTPSENKFFCNQAKMCSILFWLSGCFTAAFPRVGIHARCSFLALEGYTITNSYSG